MYNSVGPLPTAAGASEDDARPSHFRAQLLVRAGEAADPAGAGGGVPAEDGGLEAEARSEGQGGGCRGLQVRMT